MIFVKGIYLFMPNYINIIIIIRRYPMEYVEPQFNKTAFNCPHCNAYATQHWYNYVTAQILKSKSISSPNHIDGLYICKCVRCEEISIWKSESIFKEVISMIYPLLSTAPLPANDMPEECKQDYNEARNIFALSPKASTALLRLCLQKLCVHLGQEGKHINTDIGNLVKAGLPAKIQKALDVVRVVGNNAVHPGKINIDDNTDIAFRLFKLINLIVESMITQPNEIDELYQVLPQNALEDILKRDK